MIRINLLPHAKRTVRSATPSGVSGSNGVWIGIYAAAALLTLAACAIWYVSLGAEVEAQVRENNELQQRISTLRAESAGLEEVQATLQQSLALEEVVEQLNAARLGPTRAMLELSRILGTGPGSGPTINPEALERMRRDNPLAGYNRSWDSRRLWVTLFHEEGRECQITGQGRTNEDVAEFLRRLALSEIFENVTLQRTQATKESQTDLDVIAFELTCKVIY